MSKELLEYWEGISLFLANHGWTKKDERAIQIKKLIEQHFRQLKNQETADPYPLPLPPKVLGEPDTKQADEGLIQSIVGLVYDAFGKDRNIGLDGFDYGMFRTGLEQLLSRPQKQVTREWVRKWEEKIEHICNQGEMPDLDTMLQELEIGVVEK